MTTYVKPYVKMPFNMGNFLNNQTVEYLETVCLDYNARKQILMNCAKLNFSCGKYLIDCYLDGIYEWDENIELYSHLQTIPFNCMMCWCNEKIVLYLLNMCVEKKFVHALTFTNHHGMMCSIHHLSVRGNTNMINRILDIYIKYNLNFECKTSHGFKAIDYILRFGTLQTIKRIIDIYVEMSLFFDNSKIGPSLHSFLEKNIHPNVKFVMGMYLNEVLVTEYIGVQI